MSDTKYIGLEFQGHNCVATANNEHFCGTSNITDNIYPW